MCGLPRTRKMACAGGFARSVAHSHVAATLVRNYVRSYFGGKGLPFFKWSVPGKQNGTPEDGALAKQACVTWLLVHSRGRCCGGWS